MKVLPVVLILCEYQYISRLKSVYNNDLHNTVIFSNIVIFYINQYLTVIIFLISPSPNVKAGLNDLI